MYRLMKLDQSEALNVVLKLCEKQKLICNQCFPCYIRNEKISTSRFVNTQNMSALKHLVLKKFKKARKNKIYLEMLKGAENKIVNATTTASVIRGKQLSELANKFVLASSKSQNVHCSTRRLSFHSVDSTRRYDPLLQVPVELRSFNADNLCLAQYFPEKKSAGGNKNILNNSFPLTLTIDDVLTRLKNSEAKTHKVALKKTVKKLKKRHSSGTNMETSLKSIDPVIAAKRDEELNSFLRSDESFENSETVAIDLDETGPVSIDESVFLKSAVVEDDSAPIFTKTPKARSNISPTYNVNPKKNIREIIAKKKLPDLDKNRRVENLNSHFLSYVDVCVQIGMINNALVSLKSYRKKISIRKDWQPRVVNVDVYNNLLMGFADEGNWQKMLQIISIIEEDGIKLNACSYAAILNCLGRKRNVNLAKEYWNRSKVALIKVSEILNCPNLSSEGQNYVMTAIKMSDPDFHPDCSISLNYNCSLLNYLNNHTTGYVTPLPDSLSADYLKEKYEEQIYIEKNNYVKIKTIEKRRDGLENVELYRDKLNDTQSKWKSTIEEAFDRDLEILKSQKFYKAHSYLAIYPYLMSIPRDDFVEIMLQEIRKLAEGSETYSPTTRQLYRDLGHQVFLRYLIRKKSDKGVLKKLDELFMKYCDWYATPDSSSSNPRQKWQQILNKHCALQLMSDAGLTWKGNVLIAVGHFLYNIILRDVKIDVNILRGSNQKEHFLPAFYTLFRSKGYHSKEEVKPHPTLSRLFRAAAPEHLVFEASKIPMVCPPLPWSSITSGGYLITKTEIIRLPFQAVAQWKALEGTPLNNLYPAFDSLNQLGAVPWTVNKEVLDVIVNVFNSGGSSKLDVPEPPSSYPTVDPITSDMTPTERGKVFRQRLVSRRRKAEMYSLWCDALYKLSLANHFRDQVFWLPHNMDFRGRVYPVAPHLNHLGSDLSRSLLIFAKGKELGVDGFDWLKIHAINLTGTHKKKSVQDRLDYANSILDDIVDSAKNPLSGKMWWAKSEEPWQTLAACMEVRNALASGNPATYVSQFPVHQDGSCNGLQHYAALGRDLAGGESVNLTPAAVPQDVYSCVAAIVERERAKDAANGVKIAQELEGFIYRKVIKQTVMTTVYGVTRFGARLQIARQLKDLESFPKQYVWQASMYLVNKTFDSLQEMFTSTKEIQDWFTECARLIAQVCGENVEWITPLGLPIVQPYSRSANKSSLETKYIDAQTSTATDAFERPNVMKQKNAFAPNFIHSLDSSHMMLTSIVCERRGVTFVSVHDCYWTHAASVATMNSVCRDQFVALHSHPILSDLSKYFMQRFAYLESSFCNDGSVADLAKRNLNRILQDLPRTGSLDLNAVLKSPYFFS